MNHDLSFTLKCPSDERETLMSALRSVGADVQQQPVRDIDWQAIVVLFENVGKIASGATAAIVLAEKVAEKLNAWRATQRRKGKTPRGTLHRPGQPPLDLATATDDEVLRWLLQTPLQP